MEKKRIWFYISTALLFSVCLLGQILCDAMGYGSELFHYMIRMAAFAFNCWVLSHLVKALQKPGAWRKALTWILGVILVGWTGLVVYNIVYYAANDFVVYGTGWAISGTSISEDNRYMSSLTHWFGRGDSYYEYTEQDAVPVSNDAEGWEAEPYASASMERAKASYIYYDFRGAMLLNVVGYMYGRWYVVLYASIMLMWTVAAVQMVLLQGKWLIRLFMFVMLTPVLMTGWGAVSNAFGICYIMPASVFAFSFDLADAIFIQFFFIAVFMAMVMTTEKNVQKYR